MKRMIVLLLALCMALCLAACGGEDTPETQPDASNTASPTQTEAEPTPEPSPDATTEQTEQPSQASGGAGGWSALLTEYQKRFGTDIEAFNTGPDTAMRAFSLIRGDLDLAFTATFFGPDAEKATQEAFKFFGMQDVTYSEEGDTAVAQGVDPNGVSFEITLKYDGGNTAAMYYTLDGELSTELSICVTDEYAAKMYKGYDDEKTETVCAIVKPNGDVWLGVDTKVLEGTLYQNEAAAADPAFATGLPESYTFIDGVFTKINET